MTKLGPLTFIMGLMIAGFASLRGTVVWGLGALGIVVGLLNITDREIRSFLIASMTFMICANALSVTFTKIMNLVPALSEYAILVDSLLANVVLFVAPGAAIVALKALYNITKD